MAYAEIAVGRRTRRGSATACRVVAEYDVATSFTRIGWIALGADASSGQAFAECCGTGRRWTHNVDAIACERDCHDVELARF